ncbi:hydantoinase B/oxoprolinase family protein [Herbaspirillum sp. YR522]|uniref:hydantoinase B/oxoprolinase family protein n=1 Tax=Herbaspirillum sp. YR522 TaxID=1144342 RepID=UPI00026FB3E1|nr:hydantoinase B/oxoprolinase family protein [Herbaspirillum sp. YR522]EJM97732.1 N-methylhydantoinase B/acetone carboxylase, alpha subunit [Herbaspirillum sp. YR522]
MKLDPISIEILGNKLTAIAEEMCLTLQRTGRTLYVKETADFCCALVGLDGKFFAYPRALGVSGFVGLDCSTTIAAVGPLEPGDVILTNDPYRSRGLATHLPDLQVIEPYFHERRIVGYGWGFLHASDVGGKVPSSISPTNHEIFQEGLQIPPLKIMRAGRLNEDVALLFRANSRTPDANMGDLKAMLGALATGRERVAQTLGQHDATAFLDAQSDLVEYAAMRARAVLRQVPAGTYRFTDYLDDEAGAGLPVRIALAVTLADGNITLDFTGSDPQVAAAINIPSHGLPHAWLTLRILALVATLDKSVPINAGLLAPVSVVAPAGSVVNPLPGAAVGVRHAAAVRVNDVLNGVLGQALPELMPAASGGTIIPVVVAEPSRHGHGQNVQVVEPMVGGTGARRGFDGADGRDSSISNLSNNPVETVEAETGVEIVRYGLRPDSAGAGQWRGGSGQEIRFRILQDDSSVLARGMERLRFRPWGAQGGGPGAPARLVLQRPGESARELGKIDLLPVAAGDEILIQTPGGGGWGDPFARLPEAVLADVRRGLLSVDAARRDYGVALRADQGELGLDQAATDALRAQPRGTPSRFGTERDAWERVFPAALLDRFNDALFAQPPAARARKRRQAFGAVLGGLPEGFPRALASEPALVQAAAHFEREVQACSVPAMPADA